MENIRQLICNCFISPDYHPILVQPFWQNNKLCATDGHVLIRIDKNLVENPEWVPQPQPKTKYPDTGSVIPEYSLDIPLTVNQIQNAIQKAKIVDEYEPCDDCHGTGMVTWEYEGLVNDYTKEDKCPVCGGDGHRGKTGRRIPDPDQPYQIQGLTFKGKRLTWLLKVMEYLQIQELTINGVTDYTLLLTLPGIEILIASSVLEDVDKHKKVFKIL